MSSTPAKEARSRVGGMRDWPLAALLFGSAIVVYTVFGLGVYTALAAVL